MTTLISEESKSEHFKKHINDPEYGGECILYAQQISTIINNFEVEEVLDYGAGKGELPANLTLDHKIQITLYDPAIPDISEYPEPKEMTVCVNVLEYVEEHLVDDVLDDLKRCTRNISFIVIDEPFDKWAGKILERFSLDLMVRHPEGFFVVARTKHGN